MNVNNLSLGLFKGLCISAVLSITAITLAGDKVDSTLDTSPDGVVEIQNIRGEIKVVGWDKNEVRVSGELDDLTEEFIFEKDGKVILVKIKMPHRNINRGDGSDLLIQVPNGNQVDFNGISTDVEIDAVKGGIEVRSVSGDVEVQNNLGVLIIGTVSGDIRISDSKGKAKLDSVSGEIKADMDSSDVMANTVSGDIKLTLQKYKKLGASTVSGDIRVSGQMLDSGKARLNSVSGDLRINFSGPVNARASIHAGPGGDIQNGLSSDKVKDIFPNQQKLIMTLGDGSGAIKASTVNGSIKLNGNK